MVRNPHGHWATVPQTPATGSAAPSPSARAGSAPSSTAATATPGWLTSPAGTRPENPRQVCAPAADTDGGEGAPQTIQEEHTMTIDLETLTLAKGAHENRDDGLCLMEAVAWFAGRPHSDKPPCVSPVLGTYGRALNDVLPDIPRQELRQFIPQLPGTAGDGKDETRGYIALDWLIRTWTPAWLDLAGLTAEAAALRDFRRIADLAAAQAVR